MHAHNISLEKYNEAKKLFAEANAQLEQQLDQLLQYPESTPLSEKIASTLYEKLIAFNDNAEQFSNGLAMALEVFAKLANASVSKDYPSNLERLLQFFGSTAFDGSEDTQSKNDVHESPDGEVSEDE